MKIVEYFKNMINKTKNRNKKQLLLDSPKNLYKDLVNSPEIDTMIKNT